MELVGVINIQQSSKLTNPTCSVSRLRAKPAGGNLTTFSKSFLFVYHGVSSCLFIQIPKWGGNSLVAETTEQGNTKSKL